MQKQYRRRLIKSYILMFFSIIFFFAGVIIMSQSEGKEKCSFDCYEKSCLDYKNRNFPCVCGSTCKPKVADTTVLDNLGVCLIVVGVFGSVAGFVLIYMYRNKCRNPPAVQTIIIQEGQPAQVLSPTSGLHYSPNMAQSYSPNNEQPSENIAYGYPILEQIQYQPNFINQNGYSPNQTQPLYNSNQNQIIFSNPIK